MTKKHIMPRWLIMTAAVIAAIVIPVWLVSVYENAKITRLAPLAKLSNIADKPAQDRMSSMSIACKGRKSSFFFSRREISCAELSISREMGWGENTIISLLGAMAGKGVVKIYDDPYSIAVSSVSASFSPANSDWITIKAAATKGMNAYFSFRTGSSSPFTADTAWSWQSLRAEGDLAAAAPAEFSINIEHPSFANYSRNYGSDWNNGEKNISADYIKFESRQEEGNKVRYRFSAANLSLPYHFSVYSKAPAGRLPKAQLTAELVIAGKDGLIASLPQIIQFINSRDFTMLAGQSAEIKRAGLSFAGGSGINIMGKLTLSKKGRLNGVILAEIKRPAMLAQVIRPVFSALATKLAAAILPLSRQPGSNAEDLFFIVTIRDGQILAGPVNFGTVPLLAKFMPAEEFMVRQTKFTGAEND